MIKITKGMARKLYNEGKEVMIIPDHIRPDSPLAFWTTRPNNDDLVDFERICEAVFYYNCSPDTGMKLAYYAKEV